MVNVLGEDAFVYLEWNRTRAGAGPLKHAHSLLPSEHGVVGEARQIVFLFVRNRAFCHP